MLAREIEAGILQGRAHPIARFLHLGIRQTHQRHRRQTTCQMYLDRDFRSGESVETAAMDDGKWHKNRGTEEANQTIPR